MHSGTRSKTTRSALGERLGGFIYGTIVALSVIVGGAKAYPASPERLAGLVAVTCVTFWLAHVYAHGLGHSVAHGERLSLAELRHIARREGAIVVAAIPPVFALVLGAIGFLEERTAVWLAFGLGLGVLALEGFVFARAERLGWLATLAVVAVNLAFGLALVALKLVVTH